MRLTTAAMALGIGLVIITALAGREPVFFALPVDAASLAAYKSQEVWRIVICAIGAGMTVMAFAAKLFGKGNVRRTDGQ